MVSIALTLAVVLGMMGVALRFLRKYTMGAQSAAGGLEMQVVQRLTIGQRQGIAVVRIGSRLLAVSMGDGGIRPLAELNPADLPSASEKPVTSTPMADVLNLRGLTSSFTKAREVAVANTTVNNTKRVSYVAPIEDFQAVLNMAMGSPAAR